MSYQLAPILGGHSGAKLYRVTVTDDDGRSTLDGFDYLSHLPIGNYCLKIFPSRFRDEHLCQIRDICAVYQSLDIPALRLLQSGPTKDGCCYCIYNYLDGQNFEVAGEERSCEENYRVGLQVGTWLHQLKDVPAPGSLAHDVPDLDKMTTDAQEYCSRLCTDSRIAPLLQEFFPSGLIESLPARLDQARTAFAHLETHLIHGDIKRSNLMLDPADKLWFIDIESMRPSYDFLNFRHQMTWMLSSDSARKQAFNRGLFDGLYDYTRPPHFQEWLTYVLLINFLEHCARHFDDLDTLRDFFRRLQFILPQVLNSTKPII